MPFRVQGRQMLRRVFQQKIFVLDAEAKAFALPSEEGVAMGVQECCQIYTGN